MNRKLLPPESCIQLASNFIGLQEINGAENNPIIMDMFGQIGHKWVKDDETAWCSCFVNYIASELNLKRSGRLNARSWLNVGEDVRFPKVGDVVIFWRESENSWKGHVGFFAGYTEKGDIFCLGGNQGNEVCISTYPKERLLGFRRLLKV